MNRTALLLLATLAAASGGCGAQSILLGTEGSYLFTAMDVLAVPGDETALAARLQGGDFLRGKAGVVIRFLRDGKLYAAAETDSDGAAVVQFTPEAPGDYRFTVEVAPAGLPDSPPSPVDILVACRKSDAPLLVVDMDKTVVASGFHTVLIGKPDPMPDSARVLTRLAGTHTVVYLTHRPDYFGPKSEAWLKANGYPKGPLLLSSAGGFMKGSSAFKTAAIQEMKKKFNKIEIGIGDKISDAQAYHANGLRSFLIISIPEDGAADSFEGLAEDISALPDEVQVVTGWKEIEQAVFSQAKFNRSAMEKRLRTLAAQKKAAEKKAGK